MVMDDEGRVWFGGPESECGAGGSGHDVNHVYDALPDGRSFVNAATGEIHACGDACDAKEEMGDRVVCRLTRAVLYGALAAEMRPSAPKKRARMRMEAEDALERDRASRRRLGDMKLRQIFGESAGLPLESYVDRANRVYEWLGEKTDFKAVLYATLVCVARGVDTPFAHVTRDEALARALPPMRRVGAYDIHQNAVTKTVTAIKTKRCGARMCI
jgi:hypothetical protein